MMKTVKEFLEKFKDKKEDELREILNVEYRELAEFLMVMIEVRIRLHQREYHENEKSSNAESEELKEAVHEGTKKFISKFANMLSG